uniref:DDE-1 domain-containing protein n=1 Tax=Chlorocebus sabaeus TaxID=60711 RepID=A0A0D9RRR5_CHLSB
NGCPSERKSHTSLTLNEKQEMTKLNEEVMLKANTSQKVGLLHNDSHAVNAKEKFLNTTPVNTSMIKKQNSLIADMESFIGLDRSNYQNISLSQNLQRKTLTLFNSVKDERGEEAAEEKLEGSRGWMRFKERCYLHNIKLQSEAANAATASYPEVISGYTEQQMNAATLNSRFFSKMLSRTFTATEETSTPGFKVSKDKLTLLGANAAGDFKLKPMLIYHSNPRALKNYATFTLPVLYKWNNKALMTTHLFTTWYTEYFKPTVETYLLLIDSAPNHQRVLMEMYKEINVFMPANATSILEPKDQVVIFIFKYYYLRHTFHKAITTTDSDSTDGSGQSTLKPFWKVIILDTVQNSHDSQEVKMSTLTELMPILLDDFERFKTSVEEVIADVVETARELELAVEPEDMIELLSFHDKTLTDEVLLLMDEQRKFLEIESTPGEDAVNLVEMTTKDLEHYINLAGKVVAGFERTDFNFKGRSTVRKMLAKVIIHYREIFCEKSQSMWQTLLLSYFQKLPQPHQPSATTTL